MIMTRLNQLLYPKMNKQELNKRICKYLIAKYELGQYDKINRTIISKDEQTSTSRDNDSPQPVPVSEDESTRSKPDGLSLSMISPSLGELSQFSLCFSKEGPTAVDSASEWFLFEDLPDDLGDCCSRLYPPDPY